MSGVAHDVRCERVLTDGGYVFIGCLCDRRRAQAEAWDEAVQALGWALNNGPSERAMPYVAEHNPYRAAQVAPSREEGP